MNSARLDPIGIAQETLQWARARPLVVDVLPDYDHEDLKRVCIIPQQTAFWRRSAYEAAGGFDKSFQFALDYDLFLRIAARGRFHASKGVGAGTGLGDRPGADLVQREQLAAPAFLMLHGALGHHGRSRQAGAMERSL